MTAIALYELASELRAVHDQLNDLELPPETVRDTLESLSMPFEEKATSIAAYVRNIESTAMQIKAAEDAMAARRKALEKRAKDIRQYVLDQMKVAGIRKIECPYFVVSIVKNPPSVVINEPGLIPSHYMTAPAPPPPQPDKKLIAQAIKDGYEVPGAHIEQGERLSIK